MFECRRVAADASGEVVEFVDGRQVGRAQGDLGRGEVFVRIRWGCVDLEITIRPACRCRARIACAGVTPRVLRDGQHGCDGHVAAATQGRGGRHRDASGGTDGPGAGLGEGGGHLDLVHHRRHTGVGDDPVQVLGRKFETSIARTLASASDLPNARRSRRPVPGGEGRWIRYRSRTSRPSACGEASKAARVEARPWSA